MSEQVTENVPDGTQYPWAQDLEGVWHKRPESDEWGDPAGDVQAHGVCGAAFPSVHVSTYKPIPEPGLDEGLCRTCGCECWMTPPETWLSAASLGYGSGHEPGSQWEQNPDCPVHPAATPHPWPSKDRHEGGWGVMGERRGWFADWDDEATTGYGWQPCLETGQGHIPCFEVWFATKARCEEWIAANVIGVGWFPGDPSEITTPEPTAHTTPGDRVSERTSDGD